MTMKILRKTLVSVLFFMCICIGTSAEAKEKPTSGKDDNGIQWTYDKTTKTLTFSGNKHMAEDASMDGHSRGVEWDCWSEEAEHIVLEEGITGVGAGTFDLFVNVQTVQLPESVMQIDNSAFRHCRSLQKVILPAKLEKIGEYAFGNCELLAEITIPDTVTSIGSGAFHSCEKIKRIEVPDSVKKIGVATFAYCNELENVTLPKTLKEISPQLFMFCKKLKVVRIPARVTKIGEFAFAGTGLKEIVIPSKVTKFYTKNKRTYESMSPLFKNCKKLKRITIKSRKIKSVYRYAFSCVTKKTTIRVPKSKLKTYKKMFRKAGLSKKVKVRAI